MGEDRTWEDAGALEGSGDKAVIAVNDRAQNSQLERQEQGSPLHGFGSVPEGRRGIVPCLPWRQVEAQIRRQTGPRSSPYCPIILGAPKTSPNPTL